MDLFLPPPPHVSPLPVLNGSMEVENGLLFSCLPFCRRRHCEQERQTKEGRSEPTDVPFSSFSFSLVLSNSAFSPRKGDTWSRWLFACLDVRLFPALAQPHAREGEVDEGSESKMTATLRLRRSLAQRAPVAAQRGDIFATMVQQQMREKRENRETKAKKKRREQDGAEALDPLPSAAKAAIPHMRIAPTVVVLETCQRGEERADASDDFCCMRRRRKEKRPRSAARDLLLSLFSPSPLRSSSFVKTPLAPQP